MVYDRTSRIVCYSIFLATSAEYVFYGSSARSDTVMELIIRCFSVTVVSGTVASNIINVIYLYT